jgi:hypothetical protein
MGIVEIKPIYYNIHDLVRIKVIGGNRFDRTKDMKFYSFKEDNIDDPDIVLRMGKFKPSNHGCQTVEGMGIKENYIYYKKSSGTVRWEMEIFGFDEGKTEVNFHGYALNLESFLLPSRLAQDILIPLIELKLAEKKFIFLHGGAISQNQKQTYIFCGRQGAFKTTLILNFVRQGFGFLGDDRVIFGDKRVLCCPISPFIFQFMLDHLPTEELNLWSKFRIAVSLIKSTRSYNLPVTLSSEPRALVFIDKVDTQSVRVSKLTVNQALYKLEANNKLEMNQPGPTPSASFFHYMAAYSFVFPNSRMAGYWQRFRDIVARSLNDIPIYCVEIPYKYSERVFNEIHEFVNKIVVETS